MRRSSHDFAGQVVSFTAAFDGSVLDLLDLRPEPSQRDLLVEVPGCPPMIYRNAVPELVEGVFSITADSVEVYRGEAG